MNNYVVVYEATFQYSGQLLIKAKDEGDAIRKLLDSPLMRTNGIRSAKATLIETIEELEAEQAEIEALDAEED